MVSAEAGAHADSVGDVNNSGAGVPSKCVACGETLISPLVCVACATLRPPKSEFNHFARLGLPLQYSIDAKELERRFLILVRGLHPDQFSTDSREDRALAEQLAAQLNDSYRVIRDPVMRADYLLELEGGPSRENQKSTPKAFLMEMLDINEEIEQAEAQLDAPARENLQKVRASLAARRAQLIQGFPEGFKTLAECEGIRRAAIAQVIRERLNVCSYLEGLLVKIDELLLR
ncbi:MAG: Fe-S protein assembly co-chaperone HscB [Planctomycetes bacterium]|nr:Fe-S protein assembly co-chaperone HscB [Planctomycetota bacterium]